MSDFDDYKNIDQKEVARRVKETRKKINLTQIDLARRSGSSQQTICNLERGQVKVPRNIPRIASVLGVSPKFLLTGLTEQGVPLVRRAFVKDTLILLSNSADLPKDTDFIIPTVKSKDGKYPTLMAMYIEDDAMVNTAPNGSVVVFDTAKQAGPGLIVVVSDSDRITVRRAKSTSSNAFDFTPENDDYPVVPSSANSIIGVVTEIRKIMP